jgi:transposase InsO family protein
MPWKEVNPMDEKVLFIADYLRQRNSISALCQFYGISRKTGHKWLQRYRKEGFEGLQDRSRTPHHCPSRVSKTLREAIVELRQSGLEIRGPKKIQALLAQRFDPQEIPSKTAIYNILHAHGLVPARRRRRIFPRTTAPFAPVHQVNDLWTVDFKGHFTTHDDRWVYPLTVMDHHSRFLLDCHACQGTQLAPVKKAFQRLFQTYGLPLRIRSDNGPPFASTSTAGLSQLSAWWIELGILPERIRPGKPQQNGRHERMHRTLKQAVCRSPAQNLNQQQQAFDHFRQYYNQQRPHEALQQRFPAQCYQPSLRTWEQRPSGIRYPSWYKTLGVANNGLIHIDKVAVYVSSVLQYKRVGLDAVDDGVWRVYFGPVFLGQADLRQVKDHKRPYLSLKL